MDPDYAMLRTEVARLLRVDPDSVEPDENLLDLGMDSMRLMSLFLALDNQGLGVDYTLFLESPTMNGIWAAAGKAPESRPA